MATKGRDCKTCKFDVNGTGCKSHTHCDGCIQLGENDECKCMTVIYGKKCPYYSAEEATDEQS